MLNIEFIKLEPHAFTPEKAYPDDAGLDFRAIDRYEDTCYNFMEYGTGIAINIPKGYVGLLFPRGSISKTCHFLSNSVGVVDAGYTGEIRFRFRYDKDREFLQYSVGDKIGQLVLLKLPEITLVEVNKLPESLRGEGGFGSTGI